MKNEQLQQMAIWWFEAFNAHDLERLLSLYHPEAKHYSPKLKLRQPETNGLIQGVNAMRTWWQDSFDRIPSLKYEIIRLTPCDDRVFMEYVRHVDGDDDLFVGEMLEIADEKIISSTVFHR